MTAKFDSKKGLKCTAHNERFSANYLYNIK